MTPEEWVERFEIEVGKIKLSEFSYTKMVEAARIAAGLEPKV